MRGRYIHAGLQGALAMSTSNLDRILELVWDMDVDVNMYLSGELPPATLVHRLLETCQQIRQRAIDDRAEHEIEDLERAARGLSRSPGFANEPKRPRSPGPDDSQLMKGLFDLRAQLQKASGQMH